MSRSYSAALPILYVVLRILIILNWLVGVAILALLLVMPNEQWIMSAFKMTPGPEAERVIMGLRAVAVLGLITIPINYLILKRLIGIVESVRASDPFVPKNAERLYAIAWHSWTEAFRDLLAELTNYPSFERLRDEVAEMRGEVSAAADGWYARARGL